MYVEGGGDGKNGRAALRQGMDGFLGELKLAAQRRGWRWKLTCMGSRNDAHSRFRRASERNEADVVVLLVDAEGSVEDGPLAHLHRRDGWAMDFAEEEMVHLMVQTMETWIVADGEALGGYYGQGFRLGALPRALDLESVPKRDIEGALSAATRSTKKGPYHKIRHASELLGLISPVRVRERCTSCGRLFDFLSAIVGDQGEATR